MKRKKKPDDAVNSFLDGILNQDGYTAFYCLEHGKQLVKLPNITIEVNGVVQQPIPLCNECSQPMSSEEAFEEHHERRKRRIQRIAMMYKNLEG